MGTERKGSCFLIADEVGLGKTKSANTVLRELIRLKGENSPVHAIYVASSVELAKQNMEDFTEYSKSADNYHGLAGFQKQNACLALKAMWDKDYSEPVGNSNGAVCTPIAKDISRLSLFNGISRDDKNPYIVSLSPKTSFFSPKAESLNDGYEGEEAERTDHEAWINAIIYGEGTYQNKQVLEEVKNVIKSFGEKNQEQIRRILKGTDKRKKFLLARYIRGNASAALYKPDLIILDEFQRYSYILEKKSPCDGYSVRSMVDYLKWRFQEDDKEYVPRVLLLSATPYEFDKAQMNRVSINYTNTEKYETKSKDTERPFKDFKTLCAYMRSLGAAKDPIEKICKGEDISKCELNEFMVRTERRDYIEDEGNIKLQKYDDLSQNHITGYLQPVWKFINGKTSPKISGQDISLFTEALLEIPEFWRFNYSYDKRFCLSENTNKLFMTKFPGCEGYDVNKNFNLALLECEGLSFDKYGLPLLWVPPVSEGKVGSGKTLVFTAMQAATRSVAYFTDQYLISLLDRDDDIAESQCISIDDLIFKENEENDLTELSDGACKEKVNEAINDFFNRPFVRGVIKNWGTKVCLKKNYKDTVVKYCKEHNFTGMLSEYKNEVVPCVYKSKNKEQVKFPDIVIEMFRYKPASIAMTAWDPDSDQSIYEYYSPQSVDIFVDDDGRSGNAKAKKESEAEKNNAEKSTNERNVRGEHCTNKNLEAIRNHFNSPLYPMVMVARSSAQEGFNLQYYGDKLMHWQMAANVKAFLQREGRLDRPGSLTLRHIAREKKREGISYEEQVFDDKLNKAIADGICPRWYMPSDINVKQIIPTAEFEGSLQKFAEELQAARNYSDFYNFKKSR